MGLIIQKTLICLPVIKNMRHERQNLADTGAI